MPSGRALFYGQVGETVRSLTLKFGNGRTERVTPIDRMFGVTMGSDEVADTIVVERPAGDSPCLLDSGGYGYSCEEPGYTTDGTTVPPEVRPTGPPGPSTPGVINTAPPGA